MLISHAEPSARWLLMTRRSLRVLSTGTLLCSLALATIIIGEAAGNDTAAWVNDLSPIAATDWNDDRAGHLLERAGFGGTPEDITRLAGMRPEQAVSWLVDYESIDANSLKSFDESSIWDAGMDPFPSPAARP